jgi:muramoyltetrapeptide carboxypeptidase
MNVVSRSTPLKPPCLKQGDTLALVAPSLPLTPSSETDYQAGKRTLEYFGSRLQEGRTVHLRRWWSAGTPEEQAADINEMFANPTVQGIVALAGGFSAIHVLDLLDYDLIRRNPKPFIGMSDNTFYHLAMYSQCGLVGFQGNTVIEGFSHEQAQQAPMADLYTRYDISLNLRRLEHMGILERIGGMLIGKLVELWRGELHERTRKTSPH